MRIKLNIDIIEDFKDLIQIKSFLFYAHRKYKKDWNSIIACSDRIRDIALYLNDKELGTNSHYGCAFDFIEFISQAEVLIECVEILKEKIGIHEADTDYKCFFNHKSFNSRYQKNSKTNKQLDRDYFKYIRSLSSIHPIETSKYVNLFQAFSKEASPYITWAKLFPETGSDLTLLFYQNGEISNFNHINLYADEFFDYVNYHYESIRHIGLAWKHLIDGIIENYKNQMIDTPKEFNSYNSYLEYLERIAKRRCEGVDGLISEAKTLLNIKTDGRNKKIISEYKRAIRRGVKNLRDELQKMNFEKLNSYNLLLETILNPRIDEKDICPNGHYYLSKAHELLDSPETTYARVCLKLAHGFLSKYINIEEDDYISISPELLYLMLKAATYCCYKNIIISK